MSKTAVSTLLSVVLAASLDTASSCHTVTVLAASSFPFTFVYPPPPSSTAVEALASLDRDFPFALSHSEVRYSDHY